MADHHTPETQAAISNLRESATKYRQGARAAIARGDGELAGYLLAFAEGADRLVECLQDAPDNPLVRMLAAPFMGGAHVD